MMRRVLAAWGAALVLASCSSVVNGTKQTLSVNSTPPDAKCTLTRNKQVIGQVRTPGGVVIEKTKHPIQIACTKEGYDDGTLTLKSGTAGATWGNIAAGGIVGWAYDSATGADNKYTDVITVSLAPRKDYQPPSPPTGMYTGE